MTGWQELGPEMFDKTLGTAKERRMLAKLRAMPDTLYPELGAPQLTPQAHTRWADDLPAAPPVLTGQSDLFGGGDQASEAGERQPGRVWDAARKAQGFRSQAHLDAFYAYFDHTQACPECGQPGPAAWLEGSASWQPTVTICPVGRQLQTISDDAK